VNGVGAGGGLFLPRLLLLVREDELPPDARVVRVELRRLLVLGNRFIDVRALGLVSLVGQVDRLDVVAAARTYSQQTRDDERLCVTHGAAV